MTSELRKAPPRAGSSITICKRCGFKNYDPMHGLESCEWCGEDPHTFTAPLVLWDAHGLVMGNRISLGIQPRAGVDLERYPGRLVRRYREGGWTFTVEQASFPWPGIEVYALNGVVKVLMDVFDCHERFHGKHERRFTDLYEPVRYKRFWREGEPIPERRRVLKTEWTIECPVCGVEHGVDEWPCEHVERMRKNLDDNVIFDGQLEDGETTKFDGQVSEDVVREAVDSVLVDPEIVRARIEEFDRFMVFRGFTPVPEESCSNSRMYVGRNSGIRIMVELEHGVPVKMLPFSGVDDIEKANRICRHLSNRWEIEKGAGIVVAELPIPSFEKFELPMIKSRCGGPNHLECLARVVLDVARLERASEKYVRSGMGVNPDYYTTVKIK